MKHYYLLLLVGLLGNQAFCQTPSTFKEVYNFQVGDTFVYSCHSQKDDSYHSYTNGFIMAVVTGVVQTDSNITYLTQQYTEVTSTTPPGQYSLFSSPGFTYMLVDSNTSILAPYQYTDTACGTVTDTSFTGNEYENRLQNQSSRACFESGWTKRFVPGLGQVVGSGYQSFGNPWWQGSEFAMVYYHKADGSQWGMPHTFVMGADNLASDDLTVSVFPNPATDVLLVQLSAIKQPAVFKMFDAIGRTVKEQRLTEANTAITREGLPVGLYFWQVENAEKTLSYGKVVFR